MRRIPYIIGVIGLAVSACAPADTETAGAEAVEESPSVATAADTGPAAASTNFIAVSLQNPDRPEADVARDEMRFPAETLEFAELAPGMVVFEMEAGSGYYTEILSRAVGAEGAVFLQNPESFKAFLGDAIPNRLADGRLPNVDVVWSNFDSLPAEDASVDLVTWIQGPHELWFEGAGGNLGDPETTFAEIHRILKVGGRVLLLDHMAAEGTGAEVGGTLHRIHPSHVSALAEGAGLTFVGENDILIRSEDPLDNQVLDQAIRGRTSQFMYLYEKR